MSVGDVAGIELFTISAREGSSRVFAHFFHVLISTFADFHTFGFELRGRKSFLTSNSVKTFSFLLLTSLGPRLKPTVS